jgi:serine/threonine protein kinase
MNQAEATHPSVEQLAAFRLGKIDSPHLAEIERHVSECDTCCQTLRSLPDDTLISLVRECAAVSAMDAETPHRPGGPTCTHLSPDVSAVPELAPELAQHSRYRVLELIGAGGMGAVYKAEHQLMERRVALKVIRRELVDKPAAVERFRREVRAAARLTHPNIVTAHDAEQAGDAHFLVMEYVEGISLANLVKQKGRLAVSEACEFVRQAALGLEHAFECGMVHRDIKPQNLMLTPGNQIKILDFGLASYLFEEANAGDTTDPSQCSVATSLTQTGSLMGTPDYIAPEQIENARRADIRSDIYSLGCTLYYLLTAEVPFPAPTIPEKLRAHQAQSPKPLSEHRPDVPAGLVAVVGKMMAKDPAERYQTPAEAVKALTLFVTEAASEPIVVSAPPMPPKQRGGDGDHTWQEQPRPRRSWQRQALTFVGLLAIVVVSASAFLFLYRYATKGRLKVNVDLDDIEVLVIDRDGEIVQRWAVARPEGETNWDIPVPPTQHLFELPAGDYFVEARDNDDEEVLTKRKVSVKARKQTDVNLFENLNVHFERINKTAKRQSAAALRHAEAAKHIDAAKAKRDLEKMLLGVERQLKAVKIFMVPRTPHPPHESDDKDTPSDRSKE